MDGRCAPIAQQLRTVSVLTQTPPGYRPEPTQYSNGNDSYYSPTTQQQQHHHQLQQNQIQTRVSSEDLSDDPRVGRTFFYQ